MSTKVTVRALAYGGKFIGGAVGFGHVEIFNPGQANPLAHGWTDAGLIKGTDGSGVTADIMQQPYIWGQPINDDQATAFHADIDLTEPTVLSFVVTSKANPDIKAYCYRQFIPGVPLTGDMAVVVVLAGLLVDLTSPTTIDLASGIPPSIAASVRMMCGCKIDNDFWPVKNFVIQATVTGGAQTQVVPLTYTGNPSFFAAPFPFLERGEYSVTITAKEYNGNIGITKPQTVTVR